MKFRYEIKAPSFPFSINHADKILHIGSCFSENIGHFFSQSSFETIVNPYGQQYNPLSIANSLLELIANKNYTADDLTKNGDLYFSFNHYTKFSNTAPNEILNNINQSIYTAHELLQKPTIIFVTMGTAIGFWHKEKKTIVSNCHKMPNHLFEQKMISTEEIVLAFENVIEKMKVYNPAAKFVFTVSPVRYFALGVFENSVAKGNLIQAIYQLKQKYADIFYFPSYEMIIDDLRDYRFYKEDLLHPNQMAVNYIWEKIQESFFNEKTKEIAAKSIATYQLMQHKLIAANIAAVEQHQLQIANKIANFEQQYGIKINTK